MGINIILADDHNIMRKGLRSILDRQPNLEVIAEAENGRMTVQLAKELLPDIVIMDITMPDLNGIEATRQIIAECNGVKILVLSMHSHRQFVTEILKAGASGYLLKNCSIEELTHAIRTVAANKNYLSSEITETVIKECVGSLSPNGSPVFSSLTPREREVLQLLAEGWNTKQIASQLFISAKTVDTHRRQIMEKLNASSIAELTKYAIREGLTSVET